MKHPSIYILYILSQFYCFLADSTIGILTESNVYLARMMELNSSHDEMVLFYHHIDPVYSLKSFTFNNRLQRVTLCSPNTIYNLDLQFGSQIVPWLSIDDTPCRRNLMYLFNETVLIWSSRHEIIRMDLLQMTKMILWNSTSIIGDIVYEDSMDQNSIDMYISIEISNNESSILHCRFNHQSRMISAYQTCLFLDYGYRQISTLAVDNHHLYVGDCKDKKIYILSLSSNNSSLTKTILPLNTSTIADIQSMMIDNQSLIWLTTSGHVRIFSLKTNQVRNVFWFDESLREIGLVKSSLDQSSTSKTTIVSSSSSERINSTRVINLEYNPWKIAAYVTSIILAFALFLSAILMTCLVLNYPLVRNNLIHTINLSNPLYERTIATLS